MPELNKANRQVCDVDIRVARTYAPFLFLDTANTTTAGISGETVFAKKKGKNAIPFHDPLKGTMTIEAQILPFKFYSLLSDGVVETSAIRACRALVTAGSATGTTLDISSVDYADDIVSDSLFVYPAGYFGDSSRVIAGTLTDGTFTASTQNAFMANLQYEVCYIAQIASGIKKVSFSSSKAPKDYFITMETVEKDEEGTITPYILTAYKATVRREFELSFSSEGDPASLSVTFDLNEDDNGNILDIIEDTTNAE